MTGRRIDWTQGMVEAFIAGNGKGSQKALAAGIGVSLTALKARAKEMGVVLGKTTIWTKKKSLRQWDAKKDAQLAEMYLKKPAATIAEKLGVSRSAVIGRAKRMGLGRTRDEAQRQRVIDAAKRRAERATARAARGGDVEKIPKPSRKMGCDAFRAGFEGSGVSLLSATRRQCRWPFEGRAADGMPQCCGEATYSDTPYCLKHAAASYLPPRPAKVGNVE